MVFTNTKHQPNRPEPVMTDTFGGSRLVVTDMTSGHERSPWSHQSRQSSADLSVLWDGWQKMDEAEPRFRSDVSTVADRPIRHHHGSTLKSCEKNGRSSTTSWLLAWRELLNRLPCLRFLPSRGASTTWLLSLYKLVHQWNGCTSI